MDPVQVAIQVVGAAHQPSASQKDIDALGQLFDQAKKKEPHELASLAAQLAGGNMPSEVQHLGFQLLEHVVRLRWQVFPESEQQQLASMVFTLFKSAGGTWSVRNKSSLLVSLVTKRMGQRFWEQLLPELQAFAAEGPLQTEKVCMVLRLVSEEVSWTAEGGGAEVQAARREMLSALMATLTPTLTFLCTTMETHFGLAVRAAEAGDLQAAKQSAAIVMAGLDAMKEYAEWAPVGRLSECKTIAACGFLTAHPDFRMEACSVLRVIAARRQMHEAADVFAAAMSETAEALMHASEWLLSAQNASELGFGGTLEEYAQYLCQSLGMWGYNHYNTLSEPRRPHYLNLMMQFTRHEYVCLAHKALPLWVSLLGSAERAQRGKEGEFTLPLECSAALMDLAGEKMRTGVHLVEDTAEVPDCFDSFEEYRKFLLEHRDLLTNIVRLSASIMPEHALGAAQRRLEQAIQVCSSSGTEAASGEQHILFEAMCYFMESVMNNVSQTYLPGGRRQPGMVVASDPGTVGAILDRQEAMFRLVLELHYNDPVMVTHLARLMESFSRLVGLRKALAVPAIQKVFDMFNDLPMEGGPCHLPSPPPPGWKERFQARAKIPGILVTYAKRSQESMRPHVQALAEKTDQSWQARTISPGERAVLCDMMIVSVCSADVDFQRGVVEHVMRGTREEWMSAEWQAVLATPTAMVNHFCPILKKEDGTLEVGGGFNRWLLCHHIQLLEKAVKRLPGSAENDTSAADCMSPTSPSWHVLNPHLEWILPTLLQMATNFHWLSSPQGQALLGDLAPVMHMGARERAVYLGQLSAAKLSGDPEVKAEEEATLAGSNIPAVRSWFRQVREALYQTVGYILRNVGGFPSRTSLAGHWVSALTGNLEHLSSSNVRMLIRHIMLPLLKDCPANGRRVWLLPVLVALLPHVQQRLTSGWERVLRNSGRSGAVAASLGANTREDSSAANQEIIDERLLRELTAEQLILLRCMQDAEESKEGQQSILEMSWQEAPEAAMAACRTALGALYWPDDGAARASRFLRGVVGVAGREVLDASAGRDMLRGAIQAISNGASVAQGDVLGLARDVLLLQPPVAGTREVLLELPGITPQMVEEFDRALLSSQSEKTQRDTIKALLSASGSEELQMALSDWRPSNPLSNLSEPRPRPHRQPGVDARGDDAIGLATANGV